jgi:iron-sulfur cluster assembly protein
MMRSRSRWNGVRVAEGASSKYLPRLSSKRVANGALFSMAVFVLMLLPMTDVSTPDVTLTASAAKRINAILAKQDGAAFLRVSVEGGGCSGFSYKYDFAPAANPDDLVVELDGARVLIDEMSLEFLKGSEIDFTNELIGAAFKIRNPNATSGCGCGTSFSV